MRAGLVVRKTTALQIVWWFGLFGALIATVVILKEVALMLRVLRNIQHLAELTLEAARGVAANVEAVRKLPTLGEPAQQLRDASSRLNVASAAVEQRLESLASESVR